MNQLSVVIITYNEEKNIGRCLAAVQNVADEIIVWDSFSTDATKAICESYNVRFFQQDWEGYAISKNKASENASYDWVLSLDADEEPGEELIQSIKAWKTAGIGMPAAINRLTNYCGHWVKHSGWYPDIKFRLFNRKESQWRGVIHESLTRSPGISVMVLKGDCYHYSYYTIEDHIKQAQKFSSLAARDKFNKGKRTNIFQFFISPAYKFLKCYLLQLGFLDGKAGWSIATISAKAVYWKYQQLKQLNEHHHQQNR